ncbi:MAG: peptidoglycan DD-metalloendopeptidase family protein [Weeksellaceae bacterium]|nr:peptidoglycan DD-metalloendopeptidase family protein [Weeksellaceae bacterium]
MQHGAKFLLFLTAILLLQSCDDLRRITDNVFDTNERAVYERRYRGADSLLLAWKSAYDQALETQLQIPDNYTASVNYTARQLHPMAYNITLRRGDEIYIDAQHSMPDQRIFVDFIEQKEFGFTPKSQLLKNNRYTQPVRADGDYTIIIQPEIAFQGAIQLQIYTQPSLSFPVVGKGNRDIHSFWGVDRDGGARRHEGVDVFAARGTPVVAAADGIVTRTRDQGRGGKQVWQRHGDLGFSIYYAHLDSIYAQSGQRVRTGDTLGTVGNTGNAINTPPHLHFGIYSTGGATDPYPFIRQRSVPKFTPTDFSTDQHILSGSNIRTGPETTYPIIHQVAERTPVQVLAASGNWRHIITPQGLHAFISQSRLEE